MDEPYYRVETYVARSSIGYLAKRVHALMHDCIEPAFANAGFTFMQWVVLKYVRDGIALNPKDICMEFRHDSGALTRVIDQLETRGLVLRQRSREDRRAIELHLTDAGCETVDQLTPLVVGHLNTVLMDFSREEADELTRLLVKLLASMQRLIDEPAAHPEPSTQGVR